MSRPTLHPVRLADEITRYLGQLTDRLAQLPPPQAARVIAHVLEPNAGILGSVAHLLATATSFAKTQAAREVLPTEVWLALGRAANELHDLTLDLDEHRDPLQRAGIQPGTAPATPPAAAPLTARRHR
ncbi:hypothetical protein [Streptomyces sp. 8L]|uniref:hypothetical protein n=1 Tax=Streptomyces sp. 8L TaxID=2877242 RepID=UPI001CD203C5|nr:hypothetical protein [Streptomyces sp. 8L]MCA1223526.1 hypothetical protein [Streptomyces sp. 8L]